jgi:thioester reductase-like protein
MHYLMLWAVDALLKATVERIGLEKVTRRVSLVGYKTNPGKTSLRDIWSNMFQVF